MKIQAIVKNKLSIKESDEIKLLFKKTPYSAFIQNPDFSYVIGKAALHILLFKDGSSSIAGYALVSTKKKMIATISFGPICSDENLYPLLAGACINALHSYGLKIIRLQPPFIQSSNWYPTNKYLQKEFNSFSLPSELNWSTLILDISIPLDDLIKSFSENHRRSLRKAKNEELVIEEVEDQKDLEGFAEGLCKMYQARKIPFDLNVEKEKVNNLFQFTRIQKNGFILKIKREEELLGGIILLKHNKTIFYLIGFADPDYKKIPVNHLLFLRSFEIAKVSGITYFDFGGYGRKENADDQVLNINKFKDGFKGKRIDYPDTVLFAKNTVYKILYKSFVKFLK